MIESVLPLPYHRAVTDILERENPNAFRALIPNSESDATELDQALLRSTYRLDPQAHPAVHAAVARAAAALGVDVPLELYADEAGGRETNAALIFVPSRAVLLFSGDTLNVLDGEELTAIAGHELAHHTLWTRQSGRYLAASRLLDAAESDARTPSEYLETARRFRLATEVFADRGALRACGELGPAVSALIKMTTGLGTVDPASYLRQAGEVDFTQPSAGSTHPETVLRAWALQRWSEHGAAADDAVAAALAPQLDLASIDIVAQDRLLVLTRQLVASIIAADGLSGVDGVELAEQYGVTVSSGPASPPALDQVPLSADTRQYLAAVLVDFATADPDAGLDTMAQVLALAGQIGLGPDTEKLLTHELGMSDRTRATLKARTVELARQPTVPDDQVSQQIVQDDKPAVPDDKVEQIVPDDKVGR